jgi:hypothetical protein
MGTTRSRYAHLEMATVLQKARIFHDPQYVRENPRKCCNVISQLLHLQNTSQYPDSDLAHMTVPELHAHKRYLKQQLKQYDLNFSRKHGRMPDKAEKEPIRHLYEGYNTMKTQIGLAEQEGRHMRHMQSPVLSPATSPLPQRTISPSDSLSDDSPAKASPLPARSKRKLPKTTSPPVAAGFEASAVPSTPAGAPCQDLPALKVEKGQLHQMLRSYEKHFYKENKRQVSSSADIKSVTSQYRRYKEIKKAIAALQQSENPRKCCTVIAQLLHLQNTGQYLLRVEATNVFFGVTKLFMSGDASLRRMVYLCIKDLAETCKPDDIIIATKCLIKDFVTCDADIYRGNALRVLVRIVAATMLGTIEPYIKQAIVDSSGQVSSSELVSASHLFESSPESATVVRRWINETTEATSSANQMVQSHAMQLLYQIKSQDRLGVSEFVTQFSQRSTLRSPLALVLLVRYTAKHLHDEFAEGRIAVSYQESASPVTKAGYHFLESSLRHESELVVYEAASAICNLPMAEPQDLNPEICVLQLFISSPKPTVRFASIRTLAAVADQYPRVVQKCNEDLETALIGDSNRSIPNLASTPS